MSHRESLDTRCTKICGVVTLPKVDVSTPLELANLIACVRAKIVDFFSSYSVCIRYYIIFHDEDDDNLHWHYACTLSAQKRLKTFLNDIDDFLIIGRNYIGVESMKSLGGMLMYFTHQCEEHKKEYLVEDIISNDSEDIIYDLLDSKNFEITTTYLIEMVLRYSHNSDLMVAIGLNVYHNYRNEIKLLRDEDTYLQCKYKYLCKDNDDDSLPF